MKGLDCPVLQQVLAIAPCARARPGRVVVSSGRRPARIPQRQGRERASPITTRATGRLPRAAAGGQGQAGRPQSEERARQRAERGGLAREGGADLRQGF